jgi:hypothetical protein
VDIKKGRKDKKVSSFHVQFQRLHDWQALFLLSFIFIFTRGKSYEKGRRKKLSRTTKNK